MTLSYAVGHVASLARVTAASHTRAHIALRLNEGMWQFAKDVHGLTKEGYLALAPEFDTQTNLAIRLTITGGADAMVATDVPITATARSDTTGTIVAADLQTAIRAACGTATPTVTWSTTTWKFTITTAAATTSLTIAAPTGITYVDASDLLGLNHGTTTGNTITDNIPVDCTVQTDLPSDYLQIVPRLSGTTPPSLRPRLICLHLRAWRGRPFIMGYATRRYAYIPIPSLRSLSISGTSISLRSLRRDTRSVD